MAVFFAGAPAGVELREIGSGKRPHRHTEVIESLVHSLNFRTFLDQELSFAAVGTEHPIADKTGTVADQHSDFAQLLGKLHASGNDFLGGGPAAYDLDETHDIGGAEEMHADDKLGSCSRRCNLVDIERGCVASQNRPWLARAIELPENLFLQVHIFEDCFDRQIDVRESVKAQRRLNPIQTFIRELLCESAAFYRACVVLPYRPEAAVKSLPISVFEQDRNAFIREDHRDAAPHGSGPNDRRAMNGNERKFSWDVRNLHYLALSEKHVNQRFGLIGMEALGEQLLFHAAGFIEGQVRRRFETFDGCKRRL